LGIGIVLIHAAPNNQENGKHCFLAPRDWRYSLRLARSSGISIHLPDPEKKWAHVEEFRESPVLLEFLGFPTQSDFSFTLYVV